MDTLYTYLFFRPDLSAELSVFLLTQDIRNGRTVFDELLETMNLYKMGIVCTECLYMHVHVSIHACTCELAYMHMHKIAHSLHGQSVRHTLKPLLCKLIICDSAVDKQKNGRGYLGRLIENTVQIVITCQSVAAAVE